ncbi:MAG: hypothetical protein LBU92_00900 [Prevotellaceae bacterium]|jgi:predicted DNA-binding transcriptional regulator YafY|nr:hypothetical protein [Prevotellaceae bacterium]
MPQNKFALARYCIIDTMLRRSEYVKTTSIQEACFERTGYHVSHRTIQLDIEAMRFDTFLGYHAPIAYCPRRKAYYYEDRSYCLHPFSFTQEEVAALECLLKLAKSKKPTDHCAAMHSLLKKIKLYAK